MKQIPSREAVEFKSCKSKDGSTLAFSVIVQESDGAETAFYPIDTEFPWSPAPDLMNRLAMLKPRLIENYGWGFLGKVVKDKKFEATAAQKKYMENAMDKIAGEIRVTGVKLMGKTSTGATITGTYSGQAINTKIYFEDPDHGEDMEQLIREIADEVYEYAFKNKKMQLEAFD